MTRKGGLKEVMRGINGGIKRLIKLLTMKYYYHCFIIKPKGTFPTYLSIYLSIYLYIYISIYLSIYLMPVFYIQNTALYRFKNETRSHSTSRSNISFQVISSHENEQNNIKCITSSQNFIDCFTNKSNYNGLFL